MSKAGAQKVMQSKRAKYFLLAIPGSAAPVTLRSLIEAHARLVKREGNNITAVRILGQRVNGAVLEAREAIKFGVDVADLQGNAAAGATVYIAATEAEDLFVAAVAVGGFNAAVEVLLD